MRIAIVTDAWTPQVNGVVRTLRATIAELERLGHAVTVVSPDLFRTIACPGYASIRLALARSAVVGRRLLDFAPTHVHIATEGPLGLAARRWCLRRGWRFTTAYHTQFPDYIAARLPIPASIAWRYIRWFHRPATRVLASTASIRAVLRSQGIGHVGAWSRGVDVAQFSPNRPPHISYADLPRPIQLHVGRIATEKNIEAFLATRHPGTKVVVGDGPQLAALRIAYPDAVFLGSLSGLALAQAYTGADVLVFPSWTDTFGLVIIEALASGVPVAAYPVTGPIDLVTPAVGALDDDLDAAIARALTVDRVACVRYGRTFTWAASTAQFMASLVEVDAAPSPQVGSTIAVS